MSLMKSTTYAPDIFKALHGVLLVYKPPRITTKDLLSELKEIISDSLNEYKPRPISKRLVIHGGLNEEKRVTEVSNLADHPLVSGPRYNPWEIKLWPVNPILGFRSSGLTPVLVGSANGILQPRLQSINLVGVYHISGKFGHVTDTFFYDGKITDKMNFKHIRSGKLDTALSRIESTQRERLFQTSNVPLDSQAAYELAKNWPAKPAHMANWPMIFRMRCIHLKLPEFKFEVTVINENERFLAQLSQDIAQMLRSGAHTQSIRRVKIGPFEVRDSLAAGEWNIHSIVRNLQLYNSRYSELIEIVRAYKTAMPIRTDVKALGEGGDRLIEKSTCDKLRSAKE